MEGVSVNAWHGARSLGCGGVCFSLCMGIIFENVHETQLYSSNKSSELPLSWQLLQKDLITVEGALKDSWVSRLDS